MKAPFSTHVTRAVGALALFAACSRADMSPPADSGMPDSTVAPTAMAESAPRQGYLLVSPEGLLFRACGDTVLLAVTDSSQVLAEAVAPFRTGPLDSLFLVFRGDEVKRVSAESAGGLIVRDVMRLSPESRGCAGMPDDYAFHAFGEEPFWAVTIRESGMSFREPDRQEPLLFPAVAAERSGDVIRYQAVSLTPDSTMMVVELRRAMCTDSMSGEVTNHVAVVRLGSRELHGCAREGAV